MQDESGKRLIFIREAFLWGVVVAFIVFGAGFAAGAKGFLISYIPQRTIETITGKKLPPSDVDFSPVWSAWRIIDDKFVPAAVATSTPIATTTDASNDERVWGMIAGLAGSLNDPYTYFLPPAENKQFSDDMSGSFEGVGMEIAVRDKILIVVSPLKGSPAEKAGIKSGDKVLKIDDLDTKGIDISVAVRHIRGVHGTVVTLSILRDGWESPRDFKVTRDVINIPTIETKKLDDGTFVIQVMSFGAQSPALFRNALREFVQLGGAKLIIDLRGNPGGYLEAAVDMASWFLPTGKMIVTEDFAGHAQNIVHRSRGYNVFDSNLRIIVLVDRGSASASEILADALRYYRNAKLVGVTTFGKGSVQELIEITPDTALKLTIARWLGPDGEQIPNTGIVPDVEVKMTEEDVKAGNDPQMDKAVELVK